AIGLLQKAATNRISADSALLAYSLGYLATFPLFLPGANFSHVSWAVIGVGILAGFIARLGEWFLFASLRAGAKASVAVHLTSTYPLVTLLLAVAILQEELTAKQWLGITLALLAGALMSSEIEESARD